MSASLGHAPESESVSDRKRLLRIVSLVLWAVVIGFQIVTVVKDPTPVNVVVCASFVALCVIVNLQLFMVRWMGQRNWARVASKMHGSSYVSEVDSLPNRNYLLAELRREMPRARSMGTPFTLVMVSIDSLDEIRARRGDPFADRATRALAGVLKRITRNADFIAHLQGSDFCVMLNECSGEQAWLYLRLLPGAVPVSDGRQMLEVPMSAKVCQYDMEALYATDVLRDLEEAKPLRRKEDLRPNSLAA